MLVYKGKSHLNGCFGGTPISGNLQMEVYPLVNKQFAIEHGNLIYPLTMVIFHGSVSLQEGICVVVSIMFAHRNGRIIATGICVQGGSTTDQFQPS